MAWLSQLSTHGTESVTHGKRGQAWRWCVGQDKAGEAPKLCSVHPKAPALYTMTRWADFEKIRLHDRKDLEEGIWCSWYLSMSNHSLRVFYSYLGKFSQYDSDTRSWFIMEHFCFIWLVNMLSASSTVLPGKQLRCTEPAGEALSSLLFHWRLSTLLQFTFLALKLVDF